MLLTTEVDRDIEGEPLLLLPGDELSDSDGDMALVLLPF